MRWLVLAVLVGCNGQAKSTDMTTPMKPKSESKMVAGPAIAPAAALLDWLENEVKPATPRKRIKLPVVVKMDEHRVSIVDAWVGGGEAPADAIRLKLDDTGMGVALKDQLRRKCAAATCAVWLEGHWGALVQSGPQLPVPGGKKVFAVLSVGEVVSGSGLTAWVEP